MMVKGVGKVPWLIDDDFITFTVILCCSVITFLPDALSVVGKLQNLEMC